VRLSWAAVSRFSSDDKSKKYSILYTSGIVEPEANRVQDIMDILALIIEE
jgi:hypothetical protein